MIWVGLAFAGWQPELGAVEVYNQGVMAYTQGIITNNQEYFEEALMRSREVLAQDPDCGLAFLLEASALASMGQEDAAILILSQALAEDPTRPELQIALADAEFARENFEHSAEMAKLAVQLEPSSLSAWIALTRALIRLDRISELPTPTRLSSPDHTCYELFLATEQGQSLNRSALDTCPGDTLDQRILRRHLSLHLSDTPLDLALVDEPARCVQQATSLIQENPDITLAWVYRGICYYHLGNWALAQSDLQQLFIATPWLTASPDHFSGILRPQDEAALTSTLNYAGWLLVRTDLALGDIPAATTHQARLSATPTTTEAAQLGHAFLSETPWSDLAVAYKKWPNSTLLIPTLSLVLAQSPTAPPEVLANLLRQQGQWQDRYNLALIALEEKNLTGCLYDTALHEQDAPEARTALTSLAYLCAARAADLQSLDKLWAQVDPALLDPTARLQHAFLLARMGRNREARSVWDTVCQSPDSTVGDSCRQVRSTIGETDRERR